MLSFAISLIALLRIVLNLELSCTEDEHNCVVQGRCQSGPPEGCEVNLTLLSYHHSIDA